MKRDRIVFHVDVNSAYLSWEAVHRLQHGETLDLRTVPSVIGGDAESRHGIVLAKSTPAKKFGVQTGEVLWQARQKCPGLLVAPPNYHLYMTCHQAMMDLLHEVSPRVQVFSIDEAFLEFTGLELREGTPLEAANRLRERIRHELGFTVNIGVSSNKLLAKMAGEFSKPDKVHTCWLEEVPEKLWPLPVEELYMVGRATAPKLQRLNIHTIGDLANADTALLLHHLKSWGPMIQRLALGCEMSEVAPDAPPPVKGIGNSTTTAFDVDNLREARLFLLSLTEMVSARLRQTGLCARLVCVSYRSADFIGFSRQRLMPAATDNTLQLYRMACELFDELWKGEKIRHFGVRVTELSLAGHLQLSVFQPYDERQKKLDDAVDRIRLRYGSDAVQRAAFLGSGIAPVMGGVIEGYQLMTSML